VQITLTDDIDRFTATAGSWLAESPVQNNVLLTTIAAQRAGNAKGTGPATYGWVTDAGVIVGAMRWPPPLQARITAMPDAAAAALAAELAARATPLPGINGPRHTVAVFAARWQELTGRAVGSVRDLLISRLDEVRLTQWPPGRMRQAEPSEAGLLVTWVGQVFVEAGMPSPELAARQQVGEQMSGGRLFVWEDDGRPVAVTGCSAPVEGVVRMTGGYTPPEHRTSWYGTALSAAVAGHFLSQGCLACITISDNSSPHGAAGLRMVGYRPVLELSECRFHPVSEPAVPAH